MGPASAASASADLLLYDVQNKSLRPWLATDAEEAHARFSPDGKWVAYASNVSGQFEIYIRPFDGGESTMVSTAGGEQPIWRRDSELFYLEPGDDVMAVSLVRSRDSISPGKPQRLFRIPLNDITRTAVAPYDVSPDGQRFLLNVPDSPAPLFFLQGLEGLIARK